jgi:hypothetical protein
MSVSDDEYTFALCLSHDVDRIYKTYQYATEAISKSSPFQMAGILSGKNPWWQFERIMSLESELGVKSSFQMLDEQHVTERPIYELFKPRTWKLYAGRYNVIDPQIRAMNKVLNKGGWEIGLQGSYLSGNNKSRLKSEKERIEEAITGPLLGNRQHYLRIREPETWRYLRDIGIKYDMSLASRGELNNQRGYELIRPFDDEFIAFPWTVMDSTAVRSAETVSGAVGNCHQLLERTRENRGILVLDWHQRVFHEPDFPEWITLYRTVIERAQEMGAWIGPPGEFYRATSHPGGTVNDTLETLQAK